MVCVSTQGRGGPETVCGAAVLSLAAVIGPGFGARAKLNGDDRRAAAQARHFPRVARSAPVAVRWPATGMYHRMTTD